jgi:hypothetical protein
MQHAPSPAADVLTLEQLSQLLSLSLSEAAAIALHHRLPHVLVGGSPRFLRAQVVGWLERLASPEGFELTPPPEPPAEPARVVRPRDTLEAASPGDNAWIGPELTAALAEGAADPGRNLDRLKIRDALLELNDALLPTLSRLSAGRLHPDPHEASRTSPWRLEPGGGAPISGMSLAWGRGESGAPQFADRPRLQVELSHGLLRVALEPEGRILRLDPAAVEALEREGLLVDVDPASGLVAGVARIYGVPASGATLAVVAAALTRDLELLVPVWSGIA